jgi:hypothetical protein
LIVNDAAPVESRVTVEEAPPAEGSAVLLAPFIKVTVCVGTLPPRGSTMAFNVTTADGL